MPMLGSLAGLAHRHVQGASTGRWRVPAARARMIRQGSRLILLVAGASLVLAGLSTQALAAPQSAVERIKDRGVLLWGSDAEGGAPYVFPDPKDPSRLIGFEL